MDFFIFWRSKANLPKSEASTDGNSSGYGLPQCPELASANDPHAIFLCAEHDKIVPLIKKSLKEEKKVPCCKVTEKVIELDLQGEDAKAMQKKFCDALSREIKAVDELPGGIFFDTASMPPSLAALLDNPKENIAGYHFREEQGKFRVFKPIPVPFSEITGKSPEIIELRKKALAAAKNNLPILITGEVGTGRKRLAKLIHEKTEGNLITAWHLEQNLSCCFLHDRSYFYGNEYGKGIMAQVDKGTLVICDVNRIPLGTQIFLYDILKSYSPLEGLRYNNGEGEKVFKFRIISISSQSIPDLIKRGTFLPELYFLLAGITLELPPLRKRPVDIPSITAELFDEIIKNGNSVAQTFNKNSLASFKSIFKRYAWPGNISELKQVITEAVCFSEGNELQKTALPSRILKYAGLDESVDGAIPAGFSLSKRLADIERNYIENGLKQANGQKSQAAKILGLKSYQALDSKLKKLKVKWNENDSCLEDNGNAISPRVKRRRKKNDPVPPPSEGSLPEPQAQEENSLANGENTLK